MTSVGVVVIGRNEGARLGLCLDSVVGRAASVVYVDSGSTDGSVALARRLGVEVVELDMSKPFCAARARNAGFERLIQRWPQLRFVQFIDGDCDLAEGWLPAAVDTLDRQPELAIVAGWLHERHPEASIYNRLADLEWNFSGAGEVQAVGGIFLVRRAAFESVGGFDPSVPAGEEPELCQRLTRRGWRLWRLDRDMARHDLAMRRFSQWWKRATRFGYASIDVARRTGFASYRRNNLRVAFWSAWLAASLVAMLLAATGVTGVGGWWLAFAWLAVWPLQMARIAWRTWRQGRPPWLAIAYASLTLIGNWPQMIGQILYWADRRGRRSARLFEHKEAVADGAATEGSK